MINIEDLRKCVPYIISIGNHQKILQSIIDFDYLIGRKQPSVVGIIANGKKNTRVFFGSKEILIPIYESIKDIPHEIKQRTNFLLNVSSGRRVLNTAQEVLNEVPQAKVMSIFAEGVPEKHAIEVAHQIKGKEISIIGPASIGIVIPGYLKLGAIGGTEIVQLSSGFLDQKGDVAVISSSGGMTNEIMRIVSQQKRRLSFAMSFGGERFPICQPYEAFIAAQNDKQTKTIVYFGELGGKDEYMIAQLLKEKKITKEVICYIAGVVADIFDEAPQFGHAKALAKSDTETAAAKKTILRQSGAFVADTFSEFVSMIGNSKAEIISDAKDYSIIIKEMSNRKPALVSTSISGDVNGEPTILGENLLQFSKNNSYSFEVISLLLGKKIRSKNLEKCVDFILRLLVDHGPYVSGAVNTIIAARAGKDLVSSLASGILTIGPRFGGAINQSAGNFLRGVTQGEKAFDFVERFAVKKEYISGIGHKKYRVDLPDPRVQEILTFTKNLKKKRFTQFALEVEKITVAKKGNLILNVDGAIAAVLLDVLSEEEGYSNNELQRLVEIEFFNALFVLSRSVGFVSHFLDQKRLDEGLFRLDEELVAHTS